MARIHFKTKNTSAEITNCCRINRLLKTFRKPIVNPAFAKRSVDGLHKKGTLEKFKIDRKQMHASENKREYLKSMEQRSVEFHRSSRASLYQKIETMLHGSVLCRALGDSVTLLFFILFIYSDVLNYELLTS